MASAPATSTRGAAASSRSVFLGVDVGTGSARAGLFNDKGKLLGSASCPIQIWKEGDCVEQSSTDIWLAVCAAVKSACSLANVGGEEVTGLGFAATCSLVAVDADGSPVSVSWNGDSRRNVIVWMDHRAVEQAEKINSFNSPVLQYCGGGVSPEMQPPKLLWVKENLQESWSMAFRWLDLSDWLSYRATGDDTRSLCTTVCKWTYLGHAHMQQMNEKNSRDMEACGWDDEFWEEIGLGDLVDGHHAKIGRSVAFPGHSLGFGLTAAAAKELGLVAGTPVGTSLIDAHAGGVGVMESEAELASESKDNDENAICHRMVLVCGTSTCHMAVSQNKLFIPGVWGPFWSAMVPELWLTEGGQSATGALLDHIIENHVASPRLANRAASRNVSLYEVLNSILESLADETKSPFLAALTEDIHVLPDFHGNRSPIADPKAKGIICGLTLDTSEKQLALLYLATVQGIAYGTRHIVEHCNAHGHKIDTLLACGGLAKNPLFLQEHADITGCPQKQVDFVLLGGDLFHENKPSRATLVKTIEILRRYCLNDRPVQFQVVSDQTVNFQNTFGHVNYEDPHFNVGLPVFSIHGNHDDPAGVDNLSAVDILSACNLVNYFGKMVLGGSGVGQITVYPILIRKGSTPVALYGLGNIRDERLNRMFQTPHAVQWMRPEAQEGCQVSDWFNILVLHQNRVKTNPKNAINEHFLPRFLDFIVWGHEHECLIDPQEVPGMGFHITQPGSSVATSLIDGESKPKHVLLLEIKGNQYRPTKIPLTSVRPFEYTEVVLKDETDIDPNDQNSILEHLDKVVRNLIEKSDKKALNGSEPKLPLVRIKVDYSGFMTINPQRFGQKYVGKVANPQDILIFSKSSRKGKSEARIDDSERLRPEELNQQNIEALVAENNLKMEILPVNDLDVALHNFVNKDDKLAFYACVKYNLEETRNKISKDSDTLKFEEEDLILKVGESLEKRIKERTAHSKDTPQWTSSAQSLENIKSKSPGGAGSAVSFSDDEDTTQISGKKTATRGRRGSSAASRSSRNTLEADKSKTSARGRGRGRGRGSSNLKQTTLDSSLGFRQSQRSASVAAKAAVQSLVDEDDNVDSASSEEAGKTGINEVDDSSDDKGKGKKRAVPTGRSRGATPSKRGRKSENSSIHRLLIDKDDDDDDDDDDVAKKLKKSQPRVTRNYGALRR